MEVTSPIFNNQETIPEKYTCDGENINPPLEILNIPQKAKSIAIILQDPDAPSEDFIHWIIFDIPAKQNEIKENTNQGISGLNSAGKRGYLGPCPPSGTHRYVFKVYALDSCLKLEQNATKRDLETAMKNHILDSCELIGLYGRDIE